MDNKRPFQSRLPSLNRKVVGRYEGKVMSVMTILESRKYFLHFWAFLL